MGTAEPVGLLGVVIVYEPISAHRVVCHARCISVGRSVFPGDSVLPLDSPPDGPASPAQVLRIHRGPLFGEFTELTPGWSAVVELEGVDLSWVQPEATLRVVPTESPAEVSTHGPRVNLDREHP
ncbi:hypothetical protein ACIPX0_07245 [Streptomyces sp. NPDC090075]|uniref:hypothetical protein n=1 Tax=unclassified Streptomyces TaxID=2593676 RepID=UPI00380921E7